MSNESEELHKAVIDARAAYHAAISAAYDAILESLSMPDRTYATELAASADAADAFVKAKGALEGEDATAFGEDATAFGEDATAFGVAGVNQEDTSIMTDEELAKWYWDNPEAIPDEEMS